MDRSNLHDTDVFASKSTRVPRNSTARKSGRQSIGPGELTPPSSGSQHEREPPRMLMSPPPEEELRNTRARSNDARLSSSPVKQRTSGQTPRKQPAHAAKRKRAQHKLADGPSVVPAIQEGAPVASTSQVTIEVTPNPKARKQAKRDMYSTPDGPKTPTRSSRGGASASPTKRALLQPLHAANPDADFIPLSHTNSRSSLIKHRTFTPIPHYEPPVDRFTPPREVVYTPVPSVSKSSKRKSLPGSHTKRGERRLTIQIKKEPPEIDLSAPLPPGSPTDDPLLLYGPPPSTARRKKPSFPSSLPTHARDTPPISSSPVRPPLDDMTQMVDLTMSEDFDRDATLDDVHDFDEPPLPSVLDFTHTDPNPLYDADREQTPTAGQDDNGDYAEQYTTLSVLTKMDPPSSCTKQRMDRWGRPVSPFPYQLSHSPIPESPMQNGQGSLTSADVEASPASLHPTILAAADLAHTALQPAALDDESDEPLPPPSTSPSASSSPFAPRLAATTAPPAVAHDDVLPPSSPFSEAVYHDESSDGYFMGHDTIAEYEVSLAGCDSSSEPGDAYSVDILGPLERDHSRSIEIKPENILDKLLREAAVTAPDEAHQHSSPAPNIVSKEAVTSGQASSAVDPLQLLSAEPPLEDVTPNWSTAVNENDSDEIEVQDAESVVRELSHEPDFREDHGSQQTLPTTPQSNKPQVVSSPPNPFDSQSTTFTAPNKPSRQERDAPVFQQVSSFANIGAGDVVTMIDDSDGLEEFDPGVIKITSDDPMAAARAAAILRLHKYDCLEKPSISKHPPSLLETVLRNSRRKSVAQSGVTKSTAVTPHRRRSLGGMIGDRVVRPGTAAVSLPELLQEAEESLIMEDEGPSFILPTGSQVSSEQSNTSFRIPVHATTDSAAHIEHNTSGPRSWSKLDWKMLDGCYTDERISLGEKMGLPEGSLASAEQIDPQSVIDRFVQLMGGAHVAENMGSAFTRENLAKRVRALKRKQSSGKVAPPCHSPQKQSTTDYLDATQNFSMLMSPSSSFFGDLLSISRASPRQAEEHSTATNGLDNSSSTTDPRTAEPILSGLSPFSLVGRMKGFISPYLPKASKPSISSHQPQPVKPIGLPHPPPELFRNPRPTIITPVPRPPMKPPNPRDLVQLNPIPRPGTSSRLPRPVHTKPSSSLNTIPLSFSRGRRGSGVSVRDLVKGFESIERLGDVGHKSAQEQEIKRCKSVQERTKELKTKSVWRPC